MGTGGGVGGWTSILIFLGVYIQWGGMWCTNNHYYDYYYAVSVCNSAVEMR
jgi:hypothetical protein